MADTPKPRAPWDLLAIVVLTALPLTCMVFTTSNLPRTVLGLPLILFCPGYTVLAALFPRTKNLEATERVALSFVLSMAIVALLGLALDFLWEISLYPVLITNAVFAAIMCISAFFRRARLPLQEQFQPHFRMRVPRLLPPGRQSRTRFAILAVLLIAAVAGLAYVAAHPTTPERFTEFYLLGSGSMIADYPSNMVLGADADVTFAIVNREGEEATYQVQILFNNSQVQAANGVTLADSATWEETVTLTPTVAGDDQQVEFLLYRAGKSEPYRELHLWIDVRNPSIPPSTP